MIYSRYLVSDSRRVSRSPFRWLSDLARRGSLSYPAGQEYQKGRHLAENIPQACEHGESEPHMIDRPCPEDLGPNVSCTVRHFTLCHGGQAMPEPFYITDPV